MNSNYLS